MKYFFTVTSSYICGLFRITKGEKKRITKEASPELASWLFSSTLSVTALYVHCTYFHVTEPCSQTLSVPIFPSGWSPDSW